jgi:hypothetical protein
MTIRRHIDASELNKRLGYVERCAETAPEGTYRDARELGALFDDISREVFSLARARGFLIHNDDRYREVEAVLYGWISAANPDRFATAEGFGEHVDGPAGERIIAQAARDRDAFNAAREKTDAVREYCEAHGIAYMDLSTASIADLDKIIGNSNR